MLVFQAMPGTAEDREKFAQLYARYRNLMLKIAWQFVGTPEDAEDVVHDACVTVIRNLDKITDIGSRQTRNFVAVIVERTALNRLKRAGRIRTVEYDDAMGLAIPEPGDGGLADALAALPASYREVILLKYCSGYSLSEIAKILNTTAGAVKVRLMRARRTLAETMQKGGK